MESCDCLLFWGWVLHLGGVCASHLVAGAAEADWIFVHQHHPLFTDGTLCRNIKSFQDLLLPLYLRYGVDAVFAGHEHLLSYFEVSGC